MFKLFKNINYSKKKLERWSEKGRFEDLMAVLRKGDTISKIRAIELLEPHNYMNVKNALNEALFDENKFVALKACESIERMGANEDEKEKIKSVLEKYAVKAQEKEHEEDSIYFKIQDI